MSFSRAQELVSTGGLCPGQLWSECPKGVPIPIRWSLRSIRGNVVVASGEDVTLDMSGGAKDYVFRHVARVHVPIGHYLFRIESLRDIPEFAGIRTTVFPHEMR